MEKILLDTDIGGDIDDAICLAYLLQEPRCDLLGITTVCGEPEKRAAVADAICQAAEQMIPIVAGLDTTLQPIPVYPTPDGAAPLVDWPHHTYQKGDAPAFLYQQIIAHPHEIILLAVGNLTNIATLFQRYPAAPSLLKGLYIMTGYFGATPLPDPSYNWNAWADPLAAKIVLAAKVPIMRIFPLEVTEHLTIPAAQAKKLFPPDNRLAQAVLAFGNVWLQSSQKLTLHDPLAALAIFQPELCQFQVGTITVEIVAIEQMGATTLTPTTDGNLAIATTVDRNKFYQRLRQTLTAPRGKNH